jgi:V8-like Glu-specific endopeptidase
MRSAPGYQPPAVAAAAGAQENVRHASQTGVAPASLTPKDVPFGIYDGTDERSQIFDTTQYPYSTITNLMMWMHNEESDAWTSAGACSGAVVANTHILTAGHCVWQEGWITGVIATPAKNGEDNPWRQWWCSSLTTFDAYNKKNDRSYDMAVVTCENKNDWEEDIGVVGWMGRRWGDKDHSGWKNTAG